MATIAKQFEAASIEEIEAHIGRLVNQRDAMNGDLLALNALRDEKVREQRRKAAAVAFEAEHGIHPDQVIRPGSVVAEAKGGSLGLFDSLGKLFGRGGGA
jgi:hypothetical protein